MRPSGNMDKISIRELLSNPHEVPEELLTLLQGFDAPGDSGNPQEKKPSWYDEDLFKYGQRCAKDFSFGLSYNEMLSLTVVYSTMSSSLDALIFTGKTETPFRAFRRYLANSSLIYSWHEGNPFDTTNKCYRVTKTIRDTHTRLRKRLSTTPHDVLAVKCTVGKDATRPGATDLCWSTIAESIRSDFRKDPEIKPVLALYEPSERFTREHLSAIDMSVTQFSIFGLFLIRPHLFGAPNITDRQLEAIVHLWAVLGYCLGIDDRYNFCRGGLDATRKRTEQFLQLVVKPSLKEVTPVWEHMARCLVSGPKLYVPLMPSFNVHMLYMIQEVFQVDAPNLRSQLSYGQMMHYQILKLVLQHVPKYFSFAIPLLNRAYSYLLDRAKQYTDEDLQVLKNCIRF